MSNLKGLLPVTHDLVFKAIFTTDKNLLISLLNSILFTENQPQIEDLVILNPELPLNFAKDKRSVLDIRAKDSEGRYFQVEMQVGYQGVFVKRSLYYLAGMIRDQLKEGDSYSKLATVIQINILDFELLNTPSYLSRFTLREKENPNITLTDDLQMVFIELPKFSKKLQELLTTQDVWIYFIKNASLLEVQDMDIVIDKAPDLKNAFHILEVYSTNPEKRRYIEDKIRADRDYAYDLASTFERGEEKGKIETARNLHKQGVSIDIISKATGLTIKELEKHKIGKKSN